MPSSPSGESTAEAKDVSATSDLPSDVSAGELLPDSDTSQPSPDPASGNGVDPGSDKGSDNGMDGYLRLQRRLILATLAATALAVPITALCFDLPTAGSLLIGALAGLLYIRLLARSVSRLGGERKSVGKVQLVVPIVLVLAAARIPQLEIVPALVGFLLYKPALIVQAVLDS